MCLGTLAERCVLQCPRRKAAGRRSCLTDSGPNLPVDFESLREIRQVVRGHQRHSTRRSTSHRSALRGTMNLEPCAHQHHLSFSRNPKSRRLNSSGFSSIRKWPVPGISTYCRFGKCVFSLMRDPPAAISLHKARAQAALGFHYAPPANKQHLQKQRRRLLDDT